MTWAAVRPGLGEGLGANDAEGGAVGEGDALITATRLGVGDTAAAASGPGGFVVDPIAASTNNATTPAVMSFPRRDRPLHQPRGLARDSWAASNETDRESTPSGAALTLTGGRRPLSRCASRRPSSNELEAFGRSLPRQAGGRHRRPPIPVDIGFPRAHRGHGPGPEARGGATSIRSPASRPANGETDPARSGVNAPEGPSRVD
jgi:hypothetical protein